MTSKKLAAGDRHYCRIHPGYDLFEHVLKGINYLNEPSNTFRQELEDIKTGKALVLCPKGVYITHSVDGNPRIGQGGVIVIYPRPYEKDWEKFKNWGKVLKELTVKEIFEMESKFDHE